MRVLKGEDAESLIQSQIAAHRQGVADTLAPLDPKSVVKAWLDTIRAIEEFINLPLFALEDDPLESTVCDLRLDNLDPVALAVVRRGLVDRFGEAVASRFVMTVLQATAIGTAFALHGMAEPAMGLETVKHAVGYFQSRRRHLVSLLYTMPAACCGTRPLARLDSLNLILPLLEHSCVTLTGLYQKYMLAKVFPDFALLVGDRGFSANHTYQPLDALFLEPERAGILEMRSSMSSAGVLESLESIDRTKIFSAAELRNNIKLMEAAYAEFNLHETEFARMAALAIGSLAYCRDDYYIEVPVDRFRDLTLSAGVADITCRSLVHCGDDYVANMDVYAPFLDLGDVYVSTVNLLSRFLYYYRTVCLNRVRRFQIRSGFMLEANVKATLAEQGFTVTDVKRINRKEFDVIALLEQIIYNVQCKNNLIDLSRIETDAIRFARYNRQLDRYYAAALSKEERREDLLKEKFGLGEVRHFVVSRFPVATTNARIIPYSGLKEFKMIATR